MFRTLLLLLLLFSAGRQLTSAAYPEPAISEDADSFGANVQMSLRTMAASPAEEKRTVRILFYGQSITEQAWWIQVAEDLRTRFPNANLVISNRAIPGFTAELLRRTAETDLYPFYPDLLIFHAYGSTQDYERIISQVRARTTADILLQADHIVASPELDEPTSPVVLGPADGEAWRNYEFLPGLAARYGAEMADIRSPWKTYLRDNSYLPSQLLWDHIHLNDHGVYLMAELIKRRLRVDLDFPDNEWADAIRTLPISDEDWTDGVLEIPFTGNRVDVVFTGSSEEPVDVRIDGRKPSGHPESYALTRADNYPGSPWPTVIDVSSRTPLIDEEWTVRVLEYWTNSGPQMRFSLEGSRTGPDGEGTTTNLFVSNSGRIVIEPADWLLAHGLSFGTQLKPGDEFRWNAVALGNDTILPQAPVMETENAVTVAQGLASGPHVLTLKTAGNPPPIREIRVYNPSARIQPPFNSPATVHVISRDGNNIQIDAKSAGRFLLEASDGATGPWQAISAPSTELHWQMPAQEGRRFYRLKMIDAIPSSTNPQAN